MSEKRKQTMNGSDLWSPGLGGPTIQQSTTMEKTKNNKKKESIAVICYAIWKWFQSDCRVEIVYNKIFRGVAPLILLYGCNLLSPVDVISSSSSLIVVVVVVYLVDTISNIKENIHIYIVCVCGWSELTRLADYTVAIIKVKQQKIMI